MQSEGESIEVMALVYRDLAGTMPNPSPLRDVPTSPAREQTYRQKKPIRLIIMATEGGRILATDNADELLPISFTLKP